MEWKSSFHLGREWGRGVLSGPTWLSTCLVEGSAPCPPCELGSDGSGTAWAGQGEPLETDLWGLRDSCWIWKAPASKVGRWEGGPAMSRDEGCWQGGWELKGFLGLSMALVGQTKPKQTELKTTITKKGAYLREKKQKLCLYLKMGVKGEMSSTWESTEELFVAHCRLRYDKLMLPVWSSYLMQCAALGSVSA